MPQRMVLKETSPGVYEAMLGLERYLAASGLDNKLRELVKIRASQIKSCAFCIDLHTKGAHKLDRLPVMVVPDEFPGQPIDAGEVAGRLVEIALSEPAGRVPDVGGPEVRTLSDIVRGYLEMTGHQRRMVRIPLPGKTARAFRQGVLTCPENRYGKIRWEEFLSERVQAVA